MYSLLSGFCFGLIAIFAKLAYAAGLTEMALLQYRWLSGAFILLCYLLVKDATLLKANATTLIKAAILGAIFHGLGSTFFFKAIKQIPASTAELILYFYPVMVTLLSMIFLKLRGNRVIAFALLLITVGCSLVFYDAFLKKLSFLGILYACIPMLTFSGCITLSQVFIRGERLDTLTFYMVLFTGLTFCFFNDPRAIISLTPHQVFLSLALGLVGTAIGYIFHFRSVELVGGAYTAIFSTFEPITTVVMAGLILHEEIVLLQVAGMVLIVAGIVLPNGRDLLIQKDRWFKGRTDTLPGDR